MLAPLSSLAMLHCENILINGFKFNLERLKGPHSVVTSKYDSMTHTYHNTTYTLDVCGPLKKSGKSKSKEECPNGTRVCAIQRLIQGETDIVETVTAISGALENVGGSQFEYEATRLNGSDSNSDAHKEGLRLVLKGGKHPLDAPVKERREQKAVVEFLCDEKDGTEGEWEDSEDKYSVDEEKLRRRDGKKEDEMKSNDDNNNDNNKDRSFPEHQLRKDNAALIWESYGPEQDADVLRLTWHTKYACEKRNGNNDDDDGKKGDGGGDASAHWGFFTWFVVVVFLSIASYLIFGSWLNYNRHGARGWDLVPHGDMIRDIPYLFKEWTRRVLNTVQGTGNRGGYSAV
ncbi:type II membrane protein [Claviceps maximensis]|nr:type II membrane protein [Claviceps maximensis]